MIIIINGTGGSGKDTFVSYCADCVKVFNISAVDVVKEAARVLGWEGEKSETARKMLADMKQISINYNDGPTKYIMSKAEEFHNSENNLMFVHIREPEEIQKAKELLGAKTLLVKNPNVELIKSNDADGRVEEYEYDYTIYNDGTLEDLYDKAFEFVEGLNLSTELEEKSQRLSMVKV